MGERRLRSCVRAEPTAAFAPPTNAPRTRSPVIDPNSAPQPPAPSARTYWTTGPFAGELRTERLASDGPGPGEVRVKTWVSGVSRGTERLVHAGNIPYSEFERMRAPHQKGSFPFPVAYGYMAVGEVESGPADLVGKRVFCLHPHQDRFDVSASDVVPVPEATSTRRAALAANMETALNVAWDSRCSIGDRVVVVGAGVVGLLIAALLDGFPGTEVRVLDTDPAKVEVARSLGLEGGVDAADGWTDADVVVHASGSAAGLHTALGCAGFEARVVEASWHGTQDVELPLGGAFHAKRLQLVSSQVGSLPADRRARWGHRRRLEAALALLADPRFDALLTHDVPFERIAETLPSLLQDPTVLAATISY